MEIEKITSTGYFANVRRGTKVHLVSNGKPICGSAIGDKMSYQWCANYIKLDYVECERCKITYRRLLLKEVDKVDRRKLPDRRKRQRRLM